MSVENVPFDVRGECVITRHHPDRTQAYYLTIDQADPHILVCDEILSELHANTVMEFRSHAWISAPEDRPSETPWVRHHDHDHAIEDKCDIPERCFTNWMLHIDARNLHVVYRIGEYDWERNAWEASWPD